uniref:Uncharacterized protein n=1 Tax=Siphoviridae sp. ctvI513 TaxID=2827965 RepID=A0A8S5TJR2_9CAUD|nr:MAG TPA: hypothetical protein [Siphoviridae sp. ctvI513]
MECFLFGRFEKRREKPEKEQDARKNHLSHPLIPR